MPKVAKLSKLFQAISSNQSKLAKEVALEIISEEEQKGHHRAAKTLRGSINPNRSSNDIDSESKSFQYDQSLMISNALSRTTVPVKLNDVVLKMNSRKELESIISEWKNRQILDERGISNRNTLFFYGPPGCGKSMTAKAVGYELSIPTYVVRFDAVIGAYLGQTAIHLRQLFSYAEHQPCVLLFDEIDALGKQRGNPLDVGELDRIVISLMQELEHSRTRGLIIATSNLEKNIDYALWRRFDVAIEFPKPTRNQLLEYARLLLKQHKVAFSKSIRNKISKVKSFADAKATIESDVRNAILAKLGKK